jgi:hypothetical protein
VGASAGRLVASAVAGVISEAGPVVDL